MRRYPPVTVNVYQSAFGQHIRQLRNRQGVTQEELAHRAGIHVTYLSGIERGVRNPSLKSICALAVGLEVPVSELFAFQIYPPDLVLQLQKCGEEFQAASVMAAPGRCLVPPSPPGPPQH